ncbi:hypothetical protein [Rossellomorea aquimaris]|uniref:Uncharacterized protein n=1 Tax=Rossellomorea aquimaris TaxID=189382 RepID=A0A5D4TPA2_9BACI|nr:hypothetical protein [Rossellomorea aquimaris]TYS77065.1 hypothetical protein FZC80_14590 [Rossellomorea aquimaris]
MNLLKIVNFILAIILIGLAVTDLLIKSIELPTYIMPTFILVFVLLIGVDKIKSGNQIKIGKFYIAMAIIASVVSIKNLFEFLFS